MSNYGGETPLQALTKQVVEPRISITIKLGTGAHQGACPAGGKNKGESKPNLVKTPIPSEFFYILC